MNKLLLGVCFLVGCSSSNLSDGAEGGGAGGARGQAGNGTGGAPEVAGMCSAARAQLLGTVDSVSTGAVSLISGDVPHGATLYIDATAGGMSQAADSPWTYVSLANAARVDLTDPSSASSLAWDLAFKRSLIYTNSGDGGPGRGGSLFLDAPYEEVTRADVNEADLMGEAFFDSQCEPTVDLTGSVYTSFSSWYNYDQASHVLSPIPGTWLVRGASGALYKLAFSTYYGTPSGGTGKTAGAYVLKFEAL